MGVVNVMPFTCMPGTITSGILDRLREDHGRVPVLSVAYDGQRESNYTTRLEAFVHQLKFFHATRQRETTASLRSARDPDTPAPHV